MPLMLWAGYGIPEGQAAIIVSSLPQTVWGFYRFREAVSYRELALPAALRLGALPLGVAALFMIDHFPKGILQQGIGLLVKTPRHRSPTSAGLFDFCGKKSDFSKKREEGIPRSSKNTHHGAV